MTFLNKLFTGVLTGASGSALGFASAGFGLAMGFSNTINRNEKLGNQFRDIRKSQDRNISNLSRSRADEFGAVQAGRQTRGGAGLSFSGLGSDALLLKERGRQYDSAIQESRDIIDRAKEEYEDKTDFWSTLGSLINPFMSETLDVLGDEASKVISDSILQDTIKNDSSGSHQIDIDHIQLSPKKKKQSIQLIPTLKSSS